MRAKAQRREPVLWYVSPSHHIPCVLVPLFGLERILKNSFRGQGGWGKVAKGLLQIKPHRVNRELPETGLTVKLLKVERGEPFCDDLGEA